MNFSNGAIDDHGICHYDRSMTKRVTAGRVLGIGSIVLVREAVSADCDEFISLNRRSIHFYKGLISAIVTPQQFANYISQCKRDDFEAILVCRKEDLAIVGAINLSQIVYGVFKSAYLGYQVGSPFAGHGYMTEGIRLVLRHAFDAMRLHRLEANIQPSNVASIALVERAGFTKEGYSRRYLKINGRWRDHERWALIAEDWRLASRHHSGARHLGSRARVLPQSHEDTRNH
jgi:ribosomal-protein-alanine N-acetyltransferase